MHLSRNYQQKKEKFRIEYTSKYPSLYNKITSINDFDYLNLIDRTFYIIKLREQFYSKHQDFIGVEYADYETEFTTDDLNVSFREHDYSFEDYIKSLDRGLIDQIAKNLKFIVVFYDLEPLDDALKRPFPLLLGDPNLFIISPFLFSLQDWFKILQNDISKLHGKPKTLSNQGFRNSESYISLKVKFKMFSTELEKRIGTSEVKHYNVLFHPTIKIEADILNNMLNDLNFNELIGTKNFDSKIKDYMVENKNRKLKGFIKFHYDKKKLCTIFFIWLDIKKQNKEKRDLIKEFITTFHFSTNSIEGMNIPNLSVFKESRYKLLSLIRFLSDWHKNHDSKDKQTEEIVKFKKVENLLPLFKKLQLFQEINNPRTFRDYYYKKTEFPNEAVKRIKHHLH